jgi:predicted ATPase with chaperone activity
MSMTQELEPPVATGSLLAALGLDCKFRPAEPKSIAETGLNDAVIESLLCKYLLAVGSDSGRSLADRVCLPYNILDGIFQSLRSRQVISPTGSAPLNDYTYTLSERGRTYAQSAMAVSAYLGPAPIPLAEYVTSVAAQTIRAEAPRRRDLDKAFRDVHVEERMLENLGPAINAGKGMFLYGAPGNGKTTLAKRITRCFGQDILIPYTIFEDGQYIKLFDSACHEVTASKHSSLLKATEFDRRWVRIRRPTVVVGGELTMETLELKHDYNSKVSEASLQLKSNCGCLLIDDFGRQRIEPAQLLNRWIIPLENRIDYLTLASGKKIEVPFEQLIIFSTNLEPSDLADDAFLRRIPYKIEVGDPDRAEFRTLFRFAAESVDCPYDEAMVDYLIEKHYVQQKRPLRRCQPRDLLLHVVNYCQYNELPVEMTTDYLDRAAECYFTVVAGK